VPDRTDYTRPPDSDPYYLFYAGRFDHALARNHCLRFISERGLDGEFVAWLLERFPEEPPRA
jgi:hypothetical protein